jgi:hypothetical protein
MVEVFHLNKRSFTRTLIPRDELLYLHTKVTSASYRGDTVPERRLNYENVFYIPEGGAIVLPSIGLRDDKFISTAMLLLLSQYGKRERRLTGDHKVARNVEMRKLDLSNSDNLVLFLSFMLDNPSNDRRIKTGRRSAVRAKQANPVPPVSPGGR